MSPWGWRPERSQGIWRHGPLWLKPIAVISPWVAAMLSFMTMYVVGDTLTTARGTLFDLPDADFAEGARTSLVALVMPLRNEATVFFDDARYSLEDGSSVATLGEHLADRMGRSAQKTLLVLVDRRIPWNDLATFASVARASGVERVLFANKHAQENGE